MNETTYAAHPHPRRRRRFVALLFLALVSGTFGAGALSLALYTSTSTASGSFTSGTIVLGTSPSTLFTVTALMPGDTVDATLAVSNTGTAQLRYAMTTSATNADTKELRDQLTMTIKDQGTSCAAFDGTTLFSGALSAGAIGDPDQGAQAGDRTLDAATSEDLCFRVTLPSGTGNAFQGSTTTATFTFDAEQTANNP